MGVWNSHTSVGNILGSLIAGYWVSTCWGLSFVVPGAIVAAMGIVCFLFLIERKYRWVMTSPREGFAGLRGGGGEFRRRGCCCFIAGRDGVVRLSLARKTSFLGIGFPDEPLLSWSCWIFCCSLISGVTSVDTPPALSSGPLALGMRGLLPRCPLPGPRGCTCSRPSCCHKLKWASPACVPSDKIQPCQCFQTMT